MQIDLECKCTATHKWMLVARFNYGTHAADAARALGKMDGCTYRTIDRRWPAHKPLVSIFDKGSEVFA